MCPFQWSGPEVSKQQSHADLDLVCDALERVVRRVVAVASGGGVGDAPVRGDRRSRELRADLAHLVAERDDPVESVAGERVSDFVGRPEMSIPRSAMTRTAFGCSGLGWLPALRASTVPADRCSTSASAI
jgi:hypothetical protein